MAERDTSEKEEAVEKLGEVTESPSFELSDEWDNPFELLSAQSRLATENIMQQIHEQNQQMVEEALRPFNLYQKALAAPLIGIQEQLAYTATQPIREMEEQLAAMAISSFDIEPGFEDLTASITADIAEVTESPVIVPPVAPPVITTTPRANFESTPPQSTELEPTGDFWYISCYINSLVLFMLYKYDNVIEDLGLEPAKEELVQRRILLMILFVLAENQLSGTL